MRGKRDKNAQIVRLRGKRIALEVLTVFIGFALLLVALFNADLVSTASPVLPTDATAESSTATQPTVEPTTHTETTAAPSVPDTEGLEGKKLVALTFDDGPHPSLTAGLLDFLKEQDVRVTFFVIGCNVEFKPNVVRRAAAEGHQIANHTYNHRNLTKLSTERRRKEIESCAALIESLVGYRPTLLRPPLGAQDEILQNDVDVPLALWSIDPKDWSVRDADIVYRHVMERAQDGDVILLHDWYEESIAAAKRIILDLKAQGYTFVTMDQLMALRGGAKPGDVVRNRPPQ